MLELTSAGRPVVLSPGTSVQLEYHSPLFDDDVVKGAYSYTFTLPARPNGPLLGFPERLDAAAQPGAERPAELAADGVPLLSGTLRIRTASEKSYGVNLAGPASSLATVLTARFLHTFDYGGVRTMPAAQPYGGAPAGGLLQVPGWVLHANEVVRHAEAYDYVFAPVRCDNFLQEAPAPDPAGPPLPPAVLNAWLGRNDPASGQGLPAGGTFMATTLKGYARLGVPFFNVFNPQWSAASSGAGELLPVFSQFACPFPRLRYVLRCIFVESGLEIDEAHFLPGELGDLVIVSPADVVRTVRDAAGVLQTGFSLADALPLLSVAELLQQLRQGLGLVVEQDPLSQRVYTRLLADVVAAPAAVDWTDRRAGGAEVSLEPPTALKLVYATDADDALTQDLLAKVPDPATLSPAVDALADLPALSLVGLPAEVRLVRQLGAYYQSVASWPDQASTQTTLAWQFVAPQLDGVEVGGPDGQEYSQGFAFTQMGRAPFQADPKLAVSLDPAATEWMDVPALSRPGYDPANGAPDAVARPTALRLLFWRGLQPASDGTLYPLLTPLHTNQAGQAVGSLSLRLGGAHGTYEQLLRGWLDVKRRGVVVTQALRLSTPDLARLTLSGKVRLDGRDYLVRKLAASAPLRKPVVTELVPA